MTRFIERETRQAADLAEEKLKPKFNSLDTIREAVASYTKLSNAARKRHAAEQHWRDEKLNDVARAICNEANAAEAELKRKVESRTATYEDVERFISARAQLPHAENIKAALAIVGTAAQISLGKIHEHIGPVRKAVEEHARALFPNGSEPGNYQFSDLEFGTKAIGWNLYCAEEQCLKYLEIAEKLSNR